MKKTPYITREEANELLKPFAESDNNREGIILFAPDYEEFIFLRFGTGDNLLQEDLDEGYNDYVNIETYEINSCELREDGTGGGIYVFNNEQHIKDGTYKITNFVYDALELGSNYLHCPRFIPLQFEKD